MFHPVFPLRHHLAALGFLLGAAACAAPEPNPAPAPADAPAQAPTLVVLLTVDQLRPDYFDRWGSQLTGGLGRVRREGAEFTDAHQDHAITETAPGHASTLSGRFPYSTGILFNTAGVGDAGAPLLGGARELGASPHRFQGTTLVDWLAARDPRTRVLSVSRKDRGAILPVGRSRREVYWYAPSIGRFTTSTYYADTLPGWVQRFNARGLPQSYAGAVWNRLLPPSAYPEADTVAIESAGRDFVFPHRLPSTGDSAALRLPDYPAMDSITLQLALAGLRELRLGDGPQTDVLAVSLSATDAVGHRWGPDSEELHDQVLRLDRMLGVFLDSLYAMRQRAQVVIALTADHGVAPFPELHTARTGQPTYKVVLDTLVRRHAATLAARGLDTATWHFNEGILLADRPALARAGLNADSVIGAFAAEIRRVPGVLRVDNARPLRGGAATRAEVQRDPILRRWANVLPAALPAELVVTLRPYSVWGAATYAQHGTPHDYDTGVPLIFYGAGVRPGRQGEFARTVDLGPTLARLLGVTPTERTDGRALTRALR